MWWLLCFTLTAWPMSHDQFSKETRFPLCEKAGGGSRPICGSTYLKSRSPPHALRFLAPFTYVVSEQALNLRLEHLQWRGEERTEVGERKRNICNEEETRDVRERTKGHTQRPCRGGPRAEVIASRIVLCAESVTVHYYSLQKQSPLTRTVSRNVFYVHSLSPSFIFFFRRFFIIYLLSLQQRPKSRTL